MTLELSPLHPIFAAEARGVDLSRRLSPRTRDAIEAAMDRYAVLVFPDQPLDDEAQMAFGTLFGPLEAAPAVVDRAKRRLAHAQMVDISNLAEDGSLLAANDRRRMFNLGNMLWHSDSSFKAVPAKYSLLHAREIPPEGGETEFADMRAAWDALSPAMQERIVDLVCEHSLLFSRAQLGFDAFTETEAREFAPVRQRLVRRLPYGRRSLFLASHIGGIVGWPRPEALMLIRDLIEHATQRERVYRHVWRVGDLVMWDNRATMHRGRAYDSHKYKRDMRRVTLSDVAPTLEQAA